MLHEEQSLSILSEPAQIFVEVTVGALAKTFANVSRVIPQELGSNLNETNEENDLSNGYRTVHIFRVQDQDCSVLHEDIQRTVGVNSLLLRDLIPLYVSEACLLPCICLSFRPSAFDKQLTTVRGGMNM
jgi:hypothetical protein